MNENLQQPMLVNDWLASATAELKSVEIASAGLDAEIILAHTMKESRTHLHAHGDEI
jgi:methylase of polypeptide subunit release factors